VSFFGGDYICFITKPLSSGLEIFPQCRKNSLSHEHDEALTTKVQLQWRDLPTSMAQNYVRNNKSLPINFQDVNKTSKDSKAEEVKQTHLTLQVIYITNNKI
jgi:hypothetical protein